MMRLTSHLRIFLCMEPCAMRKSYTDFPSLKIALAGIAGPRGPAVLQDRIS